MVDFAVLALLATFQDMFEPAKACALEPHHRNQTPIVVEFAVLALLATFQGMNEPDKASTFEPHHRNRTPIAVDVIAAALLFCQISGSV